MTDMSNNCNKRLYIDMSKVPKDLPISVNHNPCLLEGEKKKKKEEKEGRRL